MDREAQDDVDRLYARLQPVQAPEDFLQRVALATYARSRRRLWLTLDAAALALLAAVSVWFGMALEETGAFDVLRLMLLDAEAVGQSFGEVLGALLVAVPWLQLALLVTNVAAVAALSALALGRPARGARLAT